MTAELRDSLAQVQELLGRATPGEFRTFGESLHTGTSRDNEWMAEMWNEDDAQAIAAAVNWLRKHGPELMKRLDRHGAGDAEAWRSIESAPTKGRVMLYDADRFPSILIAHWRHGAWWGDMTNSGRSIVWRDATHWRPLPAPPSDDAARAGERVVLGG